MADFNQVILMGNLTREPELQYLPDQTAAVNFGMAVNHKYTKKSGEKCETVCFVDCVMFGKPAETLNKYVKKGSQLFIQGRLKFEQWETNDNQKRSKLKVLVENFQFIGSKKD